MSVMAQNKKKQIKTDLQSENPLIVLEAIQKLRQEGSPVLLEALIESLCSTENNDIKTSIILFLDDLKDKESVPVILEAIQNVKCKNNKGGIVSSCWKSGLDFSSALDVFLEIFISDEFTIALEAYSVLENNIPILPKEDVDKHLNYLLKGIQNIPSDRKPLALDIVNMLEGRKAGTI